MKTTLIILSALALVAVASPLAAAGPPADGFGHCELVWYSYGTYDDPLTGEEKSIDAPGGWYCVWWAPCASCFSRCSCSAPP